VATALAPPASTQLKLELLSTLPGLRALAWQGDRLYASRGYNLYSAQAHRPPFEWQKTATYSPGVRRSITARFALSSRLFRDGFHALAVLPSGNLIAAVPGAIITLAAGATEFQISHRIQRGTRPLHIAVAPDGRAFWGEYFGNSERSEVHVFASCDGGITWEVAHTFAAGAVRHVHNIIFDPWEHCLWIFTGDDGKECKIIRAAADLSSFDEVIAGNQQCRAAAAVIRSEGIYFASDTPLEKNYIYLLDRGGKVHQLEHIPSSSIYGCANHHGIFFSTMVEPSDVNRTQRVTLIGSSDGTRWHQLACWRKDRWSMRLFQYGNAFLPDGNNTTEMLAATTTAVADADCVTAIWRTVSFVTPS
jgi:hypothetical protein